MGEHQRASICLLVCLWIGGDCLGGVDACQILANNVKSCTIKTEVGIAHLIAITPLVCSHTTKLLEWFSH